jgi:hypothetical protein
MPFVRKFREIIVWLVVPSILAPLLKLRVAILPLDPVAGSVGRDLTVVTELLRQDAETHAHEEVRFRPPTLLNFSFPSASGSNYSSGGSLDGGLVASLPAPRASFSAVEQTGIPLSHRLAEVSYNPRTHLVTPTNKRFYWNPAVRKTVPQS